MIFQDHPGGEAVSKEKRLLTHRPHRPTGWGGKKRKSLFVCSLRSQTGKKTCDAFPLARSPALLPAAVFAFRALGQFFGHRKPDGNIYSFGYAKT
jgi:hypothetical protein